MSQAEGERGGERIEMRDEILQMQSVCRREGPAEGAALGTASPAVDNITTILIFAAIFLKPRNARGLMGNCAATESRYTRTRCFG